MEKLMRELSSYAKKIETLLINTKKTSKSRYTKGYLTTRLETVKEYWHKYLSFYESFIENYDDNEIIQNQYCDTEVFLLELKTLISDCLETSLNTQACEKNSEHQSQSNKTRLPLPPVPLPKFSGNYLDWASFRDIYLNLVHNDKHLTIIEKHHYLRSSLIGEAKQLLKNFSLTEANYNKAWDTLQNRYDNKRMIVNTILNRFLLQRKLNYENAYNLKLLLDTSKECLDSLENLGINVNTWDAIIVHIITSKLDSGSIKQWEQSLGASTDITTFKMLEAHLEKQFRTLEIIDMNEKKEFKQITRQSNKQTFKSFTTTNKETSCTFCSQKHFICHCKEFGKLEVIQRQEFAKKQELCFNCLVKGHTSNNCHSSLSCKKCGGRHHTLLHITGNKNFTSDVITQPTTAPVQSLSDPVVSLKVETNHQVLLATAHISVQSRDGNKYTLRALVDQGSQASFITERAVQLLALKKIRVQSKVTGIGSKASFTINHMVNLSFCSCYNDSQPFTTMAYVFKKITTLLPVEQCSSHTWSEKLELADPYFYKPGTVDVLLGAEVHANIMLEGLKRHNCLIALNSHLGWLISGKIPYTNSRPQHILVHHTQVEVDQLLRKFWEIETYLPDYKVMTPEDKKCESIYEITHTRHTDGKYIVCLPFKDNFKERLGDSKIIATQRLLQVENKFKRNSKFKEDYNKFMKQYLTDDLQFL